MHDPNVQDLGNCSVLDDGHKRWMGTSPKLSVSDIVGFCTVCCTVSFLSFLFEIVGVTFLCLSQ